MLPSFAATSWKVVNHIAFCGVGSGTDKDVFLEYLSSRAAQSLLAVLSASHAGGLLVKNPMTLCDSRQCEWDLDFETD